MSIYLRINIINQQKYIEEFISAYLQKIAIILTPLVKENVLVLLTVKCMRREQK